MLSRPSSLLACLFSVVASGSRRRHRRQTKTSPRHHHPCSHALCDIGDRCRYRLMQDVVWRSYLFLGFIPGDENNERRCSCGMRARGQRRGFVRWCCVWALDFKAGTSPHPMAKPTEILLLTRTTAPVSTIRVGNNRATVAIPQIFEKRRLSHKFTIRT